MNPSSPILIVDDDEDVLYATFRLLEKIGHEVLRAGAPACAGPSGRGPAGRQRHGDLPAHQVRSRAGRHLCAAHEPRPDLLGRAGPGSRVPGRRVCDPARLQPGAPGPRGGHAEVSDTGTGIPEENQDKVFEPLFTAKARGIGLGLALSKRHVEAHGGTLELESREGEGTSFTIVLPCRRPV